jgi:hypothetical protein
MIRTAVIAAVFLVAIAVAIGGWVVFSRTQAAQVAHDKLQERVIAVAALEASYKQRSDEMERTWEQSDDAHRSALQMGDQPGLRGNGSPANVRRVTAILRSEEITVDVMDRLATQAHTDEAVALSDFGDRYGTAAVSAARDDLALALTEVHNESRHWKLALDAMLNPKKPALTPGSYYANDTASAKIKNDFLAAEQSGENANAARNALQSDWDTLVEKMKAESTEAAHELANAH